VNNIIQKNNPILRQKAEPVAIDDYCAMAFEGEVEMDVLVAQDRIREFVER